MNMEIKEKILDWLEGQGYPLEMRVAQRLLNADMDVIQSDFYVDFETGVNREIDITSRSYDYFEPPGELGIAELEIFTSIECKSDKTKPWILFKSSNISMWEFELPFCNSEGLQIHPNMNKKSEDGFLKHLAINAGHGVTNAFTSGRDIPFKAVMGALKAAESKLDSEVQRHSELTKLHKSDPNRNKLAICVIPLVITDALLFECTISESGKPNLNEVEFGSVAMRYPKKRGHVLQRGTIIPIFTEVALDKYIKGIEEYRALLKGKLPNLLAGKSDKNS